MRSRNGQISRSRTPIYKRRSSLVFLLAANFIALAVLLSPSTTSFMGNASTSRVGGEPAPLRSTIAAPLGEQRLAGAKNAKLIGVISSKDQVEGKPHDVVNTKAKSVNVQPVLVQSAPVPLVTMPEPNSQTAKPTRIEPARIDSLTRDVQKTRAHELLESGSYEMAIELFKDIVEKDKKLPEASLAYEMAVAFEVLGQSEVALRHYQLAAEATEKAIRHAAIFGQSRTLRDLGDVNQSMHLLSRLLLRTQNLEGQTSGIAAEVQFYWAELLVLSETEFSDKNLLSRDRPTHRRLATSPKVLLRLAKANKSPIAPPDRIELLGGKRLHPDIASVAARFHQIGLSELLDQCASVVSYELNVPTEIRDRLKSQAIKVDVSDMSVSKLLRLSLHASQVAWEYDDATHTLTLKNKATKELANEKSHGIADLALRGALAKSPNHAHAASAFTMLGDLAFHNKDFDTAIVHYKDVGVRYRNQRIQQVATFNLAKCFLLKGNRREARDRFYSVVDQRTGFNVEPASHVILGELYLCERNAKSAVREFSRAVSLSKSDRMKGLASLALSLSYLQSGNSRMASSALMGTRTILRQPSFENAAALMSAYANYRSATSNKDVIRFGRAMTSAIAHVSPDDFFGSTGYILLRDVYAELGMSEQVAEIQQTAVAANVTQPLRDEFVFELGRYYLQERDHANFVDAMKELRAKGASSWPHQAQLQLAEFILRNGQIEECINMCQKLVMSSQKTEEKADGLRLLGRAYEKKKDHYKAAICFAGMLPKRSDASEVQRTASSFLLNTPEG